MTVQEPREKGYYWLKWGGNWHIGMRYFDAPHPDWALMGCDENYQWDKMGIEAWHGPLIDPDSASAAMKRLGLE